MKSAAGGSGEFSRTLLLFPLPASSWSGAGGEFEMGRCHPATQPLAPLPSGYREVSGRKSSGGDPDSAEKKGREG